MYEEKKSWKNETIDSLAESFHDRRAILPQITIDFTLEHQLMQTSNCLLDFI